MCHRILHTLWPILRSFHPGSLPQRGRLTHHCHLVLECIIQAVMKFSFTQPDMPGDPGMTSLAVAPGHILKNWESHAEKVS